MSLLGEGVARVSPNVPEIHRHAGCNSRGAALEEGTSWVEDEADKDVSQLIVSFEHAALQLGEATGFGVFDTFLFIS